VKLRRDGLGNAFLSGKKYISDVRYGRPHLGTEQSTICFPQPTADFASHVHLYERKLLEILRVHLVEVGSRNMDCGAIFCCTDGGAAWTVINHCHLPETVAFIQGLEEAVLSVPGFQHSGFAFLQDEHRVALLVFAEKELVRGDRHDRAEGEEELKGVCPDSAKDGHALQEFDPHSLHGALQFVTMICCAQSTNM
jgi:hypothetical protein